MKRYIIRESVFYTKLELYVGPYTSMNNVLERYGYEGDISQHTMGQFIALEKEHGMRWIIWLKDFANDPAHTNTVIHEAFHATREILTYKNIELSDETEEVYAYYQAWLSTEILKKLRTSFPRA